MVGLADRAILDDPHTRLEAGLDLERGVGLHVEWGCCFGAGVFHKLLLLDCLLSCSTAVSEIPGRNGSGRALPRNSEPNNAIKSPVSCGPFRAPKLKGDPKPRAPLVQLALPWAIVA